MWSWLIIIPGPKSDLETVKFPWGHTKLTRDQSNSILYPLCGVKCTVCTFAIIWIVPTLISRTKSRTVFDALKVKTEILVSKSNRLQNAPKTQNCEKIAQSLCRTIWSSFEIKSGYYGYHMSELALDSRPTRRFSWKRPRSTAYSADYQYSVLSIHFVSSWCLKIGILSAIVRSE